MSLLRTTLFAATLAVTGASCGPDTPTVRRCRLDFACDEDRGQSNWHLCATDNTAGKKALDSEEACVAWWRKNGDPPCGSIDCFAFCTDTGVECSNDGEREQ